MATKVAVTQIFAALKKQSTVSYFSYNFDFCLKLQTIAEINKNVQNILQKVSPVKIVSGKLVRAGLYQTSIQLLFY